MSPWNQAQNILCIRLDTIGDVLMTTPAIRALKQSQPGRRVTLLTSSAGATIAPLIPDLDQWLVYDSPWLKATAPRTSSRPEYEMADFLRQQGFDGAVIFTVYSQNPLPSAFLCYLADIPLRLAHCHENPYQLLTDWIKDPEPEQFIRHEVRRQLDLVASIGCQIADERLSLRVEGRDRASVLQRLADWQVNISQPWVIVHPGATAVSRRYPADKFAEVARRLFLEFGYAIVLTGTEPERELIESIQTMMGVPSHACIGQLTLAELAALIQLAPVLVSNNTGPVHIAAAVGTPVVDLYALTNFQHTPWQVPHRLLFHDVPCKLCYKSICPEGHQHCLSLVTPEQVVQAVCDLMRETGDRSTQIKPFEPEIHPAMATRSTPIVPDFPALRH
jgi:lipopolysaccharide heptosyltransferase II